MAPDRAGHCPLSTPGREFTTCRSSLDTVSWRFCSEEPSIVSLAFRMKQQSGEETSRPPCYHIQPYQGIAKKWFLPHIHIVCMHNTHTHTCTHTHTATITITTANNNRQVTNLCLSRQMPRHTLPVVDQKTEGPEWSVKCWPQSVKCWPRSVKCRQSDRQATSHNDWPSTAPPPLTLLICPHFLPLCSDTSNRFKE